MRDRLIRSLPLAMLLLLIAWRLAELPPAGWLRVTGFDLMEEAMPRSRQPSRTPVVIVAIDDESRRRLGTWPWPRVVLARLTNRLRQAGVRVVAFDMVFDSADRLSPSRIIEYWPQTPETDALRARIRELPDHDVIFADSIASTGAVLAFRPIRRETGRMPDLKGSFEGAQEAASDIARHWPGALSNISLIEAAAAGDGALVWADALGTPVRRVPLLMRVNDQLYPSFPAEIVRVHLEAQTYRLIAAEQEGSVFGRAGLSAVGIGTLYVPTDANGNLRLYFGEQSSLRTVPAWQTMTAGFSRAGFQDAVAIVTVSEGDPESVEGRRSAAGVRLSRAEVYAQAVEQILAHAFLVRPGYASTLEIAAVFVFGVAIIMLSARLRRWLVLLPLGMVLVLVPGAVAWYLFSDGHLLFDTLYPPAALALVFAAALSQRMTLRLWRRLQVQLSFGRSLAPDLVRRLAAGDKPIVVDGEARTLTLAYADIRGFGQLIGRRGPREALRLINLYLEPMTNAILDHKGMIDKFMGDAVMAFWNAPLEDPEHALNACRAALRIGADLEKLNAERRRKAGRNASQFFPVEASIGIVTDQFYTGEIGSAGLTRREYSVVGTGANLATHLESQAKYYGLSILTDEATWQKAPDFAFLELDLILLPDNSDPMRIYTLVGGAQMRQSEAFADLEESHKQMISAYRAREWTTALDATRACLSKNGGALAPLYELYAARIRAFQRRPPPENWNGVYRPVVHDLAPPANTSTGAPISRPVSAR